MADNCSTFCEHEAKELVVPEADPNCLPVCVNSDVNVTLPDPLNVNSMVNLDEWTDLINALLLIANSSGGGGGSGEINVYKPSVDSYADLATTYPNPISGWAAQVKDTKKIYYWDGDSWAEIPYGAQIKAKLAKIYPLDALPNPTLSWDGAGGFTYPAVNVSMIGYSSELIATPVAIPSRSTTFRDNVYIVAVHDTTADTWTFEYSANIASILTNDNWYIIGRQQTIDGTPTVTIYGIGTFEEPAEELEITPAQLAMLYPTSTLPNPTVVFNDDGTFTLPSMNTSVIGFTGELVVGSLAFGSSTTQFVNGAYIVLVPGNQPDSYTLDHSTSITSIISSGSIIVGTQKIVDGLRTVNVYGLDVFKEPVPEVEITPAFKWARLLRSGVEPFFSWGTVAPDVRSATFISGAYTVITDDGTYAGPWNLTNFNTIGFVDGAYLCIDTGFSAGAIQRITDIHAIEDTANLYVIGYMNYDNGMQSVYLNGHRCYTDDTETA